MPGEQAAIYLEDAVVGDGTDRRQVETQLVDVRLPEGERLAREQDQIGIKLADFTGSDARVAGVASSGRGRICKA